MFYCMYLSSNKEINRLLKEISRSLTKGLSNVDLNVTTEKNLRTQNFSFLSLKCLSPGQFFGEPQVMQISMHFQTYY